MSAVPAAQRTLRILRYLASQPGPVPMARIADAIDVPRSSTYHLLNTMVTEGFVVHVADDQTYGLGVAAFEVGMGFTRHEPLQRLARRPLANLAVLTGHSAHLAVMRGRDVMYVIEERHPVGPMLVTFVGVRLPAHLTASGRAILASLSRDQVRALFPDASTFVDRTGTGPRSLSALHGILAAARRRGYAVEDGDVTAGLASAAVAVHDHNHHPVAAVAVTYPDHVDPGSVAADISRTAAELSRRLGG